jgi:hypothetical protein
MGPELVSPELPAVVVGGRVLDTQAGSPLASPVHSAGSSSLQLSEAAELQVASTTAQRLIRKSLAEDRGVLNTGTK